MNYLYYHQSIVYSLCIFLQAQKTVPLIYLVKPYLGTISKMSGSLCICYLSYQDKAQSLSYSKLSRDLIFILKLTFD